MNKRDILIFSTILLVSLLVTRMFSIMNFVAVDEVNWLHRSATFYSSVVNQNWERTFINHSPGVLTTWVGSLAFKIEFPQYRIANESMLTSYSSFERFVKWNGGNPLLILRSARVIMAGLLIGVLMISFYYAQRFFGFLAAFVGFMLIAFDPFLAALMRTNHLDAPQAFFMFLSLLALLNFNEEGHRLRDLLVSGAAGGLGVLSKTPGLLIVPITGVLIAWPNIEALLLEKSRDLKKFFRKFWKSISSMLIWFLAFTVVVFVMWPAMWVTPIGVVRGVFSTSSNYAATAVTSDEDSDVQEKQKTPDYYFRYVEGLYRRTSPVVLLGILMAVWGYYKKRVIFSEIKIRRGVLGLLMFGFVYLAGMTLPTKSSIKYMAPVFLTMDFIAGLGWYGFAREIEQVTKGKVSKVAPTIILTFVFVFQSLGIINTFPYYFTYYNPMTGGLVAAAKSGSFGVGEGLNLAGKYLADKPNSAELKVVSWYGAGPFSYYFDGPVGSVSSLYTSNSSWDFVLEQLQAADYLVVYQNQKALNRPGELFDLLESEEPEYTAVIDGVEMAWVYKVAALDLPDFVP